MRPISVPVRVIEAQIPHFKLFSKFVASYLQSHLDIRLRGQKLLNHIAQGFGHADYNRLLIESRRDGKIELLTTGLLIDVSQATLAKHLSESFSTPESKIQEILFLAIQDWHSGNQFASNLNRITKNDHDPSTSLIVNDVFDATCFALLTSHVVEQEYGVKVKPTSILRMYIEIVKKNYGKFIKAEMQVFDVLAVWASFADFSVVFANKVLDIEVDAETVEWAVFDDFKPLTLRLFSLLREDVVMWMSNRDNQLLDLTGKSPFDSELKQMILEKPHLKVLDGGKPES